MSRIVSGPSRRTFLGTMTLGAAAFATRGAFADDVEAGQALSVPEEVGTAGFTFDGEAERGLVGVAAMVLDEDDSRSEAVEAAQGAYA